MERRIRSEYVSERKRGAKLTNNGLEARADVRPPGFSHLEELWFPSCEIKIIDVSSSWLTRWLTRGPAMSSAGLFAS